MKNKSGELYLITCTLVFISLLIRLIITWQGLIDILGILTLFWLFLWAIDGIIHFIRRGCKDD